jgi:Ca2+/H+ antiporter
MLYADRSDRIAFAIAVAIVLVLYFIVLLVAVRRRKYLIACRRAQDYTTDRTSQEMLNLAH